MSTGRHAFKKNDAARLIRSALEAGLTVTRVILDHDRIELITAAAAATAGEQQQNSWDRVLNEPQRPA